MQIDNWILVAPLPDDDEYKRGRGDERKDDDEVRFEPVFAPAFVENYLQRTEAEGDETKADVVDSGFAEFAAFEVGGILNQPRRKQHGNDSDGNIDEENPTP